MEQIIHKIKSLAIEMERFNPSEWNSFLEAALEQWLFYYHTMELYLTSISLSYSGKLISLIDKYFSY